MSPDALPMPFPDRPSFRTEPREMWMLWAPCGCCVSVIPGGLGDRLLIADEEAAWELWPYGPVRTSRMRRDGWHWEMQVLSIQEASVLERRDCPHTPRNHSLALTVPEGYVWAARSNTATIEHLVLDCDEEVLLDIDEAMKEGPAVFANTDIAPLCSTETTETWWLVSRADPCPDCERVAATMLASGWPPT